VPAFYIDLFNLNFISLNMLFNWRLDTSSRKTHLYNDLISVLCKEWHIGTSGGKDVENKRNSPNVFIIFHLGIQVQETTHGMELSFFESARRWP